MVKRSQPQPSQPEGSTRDADAEPEPARKPRVKTLAYKGVMRALHVQAEHLPKLFRLVAQQKQSLELEEQVLMQMIQRERRHLAASSAAPLPAPALAHQLSPPPLHTDLSSAAADSAAAAAAAAAAAVGAPGYGSTAEAGLDISTALLEEILLGEPHLQPGPAPFLQAEEAGPALAGGGGGGRLLPPPFGLLSSTPLPPPAGVS